MSDELAPNPVTGAADSVESAANAILSRHQQRFEKKPEAVVEKKPEPVEKPVAAATEPKAEVEATETPDDESAQSQEAKPEAEGEKVKDDEVEVYHEVKVNGEIRKVSLKEALQGFMLHEDYSKKTREVAEQRKAYAAEVQQKETAIQAQLGEVGFLAQNLMSQLTGIEQSTDWNALRVADPVKYEALVAETHQKRDLLQRAYQAYQQTSEQQKQIQMQAMNNRLAEQAEKLPALIPDWIDEKVASTEKRQLTEYLKKTDLYSDDELNQVSDARFVSIARKAMLYDQQAGKRVEIAAKVEKKVPKFQTGGVANTNSADEAIKRQSDKFRKSGRLEDMAALLTKKYAGA